ncbi:YozE family protein [Sporosarcina sp. FSL K6-2383]|uniref:YozE family protein n=1 Tax=Sporosarcina sp. FSL K6-2383 TaxID=2921556 RepID=UPI003159F16D
MNRSFYRFVLSFRGGVKGDLNALFAESMFNDLSFPREEKSFDTLSRYIEEKADSQMPSAIFDELYRLYEERFPQQ